MQLPATWMTRNLMWTRQGVVWATWRLQPATVKNLPIIYPYASKEERQMVLLHHQAFYQSLKGEALLLGLCADLDPVELVEKMLEGIDIQECPDWAEEVELQLDSLESVPLGTRAFWLSVPLAAVSMKDRFWLSAEAAGDQLNATLGRPRRGPSPARVASMLAAAEAIQKQIPAAFNATPATAAEQAWIVQHSAKRGLSADSVAPLPEPTGSPATARSADTQERFRLTLPAALPSVWFDEGGQTDSKNARFMAHRRRFLKIETDGWAAPSYQVLLGLADGPRGGWESPGVEWVSFVDQLPIDVDWAQRLTVTSGAEVRLRNKRAERELHDQFDQQESASTITGGSSDLEQLAADLAAYHASLNRSDKEVEVLGATIFAVGGETPEIAQTKAKLVVDEYSSHEFTLKAEIGEQENLWWAFIPGTPPERIVRDLQQVTTGREFASGVPLVSFELGDAKGAKFGVNISSGRRTPVLRDHAGVIRGNSSASFGVVGEKGGGKSVLMKDDMGIVADRGGRVIAIDRTEAREYATFARSLNPDSTAIVDLMEPEYSLDPLRVFGPITGARMVQSLCATMLGISMKDDRGVALSSVLEPAYLASHNITSLRGLVDDIAELGPEMKQLHGLLRTVSTKDFGQVLFDDGLPALDIDSRAIAFLTAGLSVPDRSELEHKHLFDEMSPEKIVGRSLHAMLMSITRQICFQDRTDLAAAYIDECYSVTQSPEGEREVMYFLRDDRKHFALLGLGAQDVGPLGTPTTRAMLKNRFVSRQPSEDLAFESVQWLTGRKREEDVEDQYVRAVMELSPVGANNKVLPGREGEMLMRDQLGRIGLFQKSLPERQHRRLALLSTPPVKAAA